jgi:hypothetical protein
VAFFVLTVYNRLIHTGSLGAANSYRLRRLVVYFVVMYYVCFFCNIFCPYKVVIGLITRLVVTLKHTPQIGTCKQSDIYQIKCYDYRPRYIVQTGCAFNARYKEYILAIRNNNDNL